MVERKDYPLVLTDEEARLLGVQSPICPALAGLLAVEYAKKSDYMADVAAHPNNNEYPDAAGLAMRYGDISVKLFEAAPNAAQLHLDS